MRYFAHDQQSLDHMLKTIKRNNIDELFSSIPNNARFMRELNLPKALDELHMKRELAPLAKPFPFISFLGAGAIQHFVPEWIYQQLKRAEWYTSYTPYQAEASQGGLQAIFEFQSMVASLLGLPIANASMYDGATALMEALLMAARITSKRTIIISSAVHPEYRETVFTYLRSADLLVLEVDFDETGTTDTQKLNNLCDEVGDDLAAVAVQSPNFFGLIEDLSPIKALAQRYGALLIGAITDVSAASIIGSLGRAGADIAVGEGLGLLGGLSLGGPGVGLFACKQEYLRQMPGRLVGKTTDKNNNDGYVLTLSTREQHIRRERATSNICTNHNLMALALSMTLTAYGRSGFIELGKKNLKKTLYFRRRLTDNGLKIAFPGPHYNETVIRFDNENTMHGRTQIARRHHILAGLDLMRFFPTLRGHLLVATTELHEDHHIHLLADILSGKYDES